MQCTFRGRFSGLKKPHFDLLNFEISGIFQFQQKQNLFRIFKDNGKTVKSAAGSGKGLGVGLGLEKYREPSTGLDVGAS